MRKINVFSLLISGTFLFSPCLFAQADLNTKILKTYSNIHKALAGDKVSEAQSLAQGGLADLADWLKSPKPEQAENVKKMELGAQQLAQSKTDEESRKAFGLYSEGTVSFIRADSTAKTQWQLFYCPMVPKGTYGYWVQPKGDSLLNPYYGSKMLTCGVKRPW